MTSTPQSPPAGALPPWTDEPFWRCPTHNVPLIYGQSASDAADQDRWSCPAPGCGNGRWV